jgi:hypothetical protein
MRIGKVLEAHHHVVGVPHQRELKAKRRSNMLSLRADAEMASAFPPGLPRRPKDLTDLAIGQHLLVSEASSFSR